MSGASDSQNPFASHNVSLTITRIEPPEIAGLLLGPPLCPHLPCALTSQALGPGADHPGSCQPREVLIGEPAQTAQTLFIVLAERGRRTHQPVAPSVERGERRPRIAARPGARTIERLEGIRGPRVEGSRSPATATPPARPGIPAPARLSTALGKSWPRNQSRSRRSISSAASRRRPQRQNDRCCRGRPAHQLNQRTPLLTGYRDSDPLVVAHRAGAILHGRSRLPRKPGGSA